MMAMRVENESCMTCGARGTCWWSFPPPWRLCADCHWLKYQERVQ